MRRGKGTDERVRGCTSVLQQVVMLLIVARQCKGWSWIVASTPAATVSAAAPPSCPSYCLNALGGTVDANVPVGLWWCQGTRFPDEQWHYDAASSSLSILNAALTSSFCLDIGDASFSTNRTGSTPPLQALVLSPCSSSSPTQRWSFESAPTLRLQSLAGSNSSNVSFVYAFRPPGQANYYLYLTENATEALSFTMVDSSVMASNNFDIAARPPASNESTSNLIINGDLQLLTSFAPLAGQLPLDYTYLPSQQVLLGFDFVLCHWAVQGDLTLGNCSSSNSSSILSSRCKLPAEWCSGSHAYETLVFLNWQSIPPPARPGSIMQTVPTNPGSSYLLIFDMKNPFKQMQSVQLSLSPVNYTPSATASSTGNIATQDYQMLSNDTGSHTQQFRFTASAGFVNVTFTSQDSTECGPLVGNIQMYYMPPAGSEGNSAGNMNDHHGRLLMMMLILGWALVVALVGGATLLVAASYACRKRRLRIRGYNSMGSGAARSCTALHYQITVFTYEQLKTYTEDFSVSIGEGGFGKVYLGHLPESGLTIAVKRQFSTTDASTAGFQEEVELLSRVHHRYIVKFLGYCNEKGERMLVFEYMANKSLYIRLHGVTDQESSMEQAQRPLSWGERLRIAYQVAYALEYLHHGANPPVLHRDIKSANVLLGETMAAKLADLGISKVGREGEASTLWTATLTVVKGSRGYLDPYYLQTSRISQKSDVYSYGVLLLELVTGRKAITADLELLTTWVKQEYWDKGRGASAAASQLEESNTIVYNLVDECLMQGSMQISAPKWEVERAMEVARWCVQEQPERRPSMMEVARHMRDLQLPYYINALHTSGDHEGDLDDVTSSEGWGSMQMRSGSAAVVHPSCSASPKDSLLNLSCGR